MKHFVLATLVAASLAAVCTQASADTATQGFTVSATLTPKCESTTATTPDMLFAYTAFTGTAVSSNSATISFKCTRNLSMTPTIDGVAAGTPVNGSIKGLDYSLSWGGDTGAAGSGVNPDTHVFVITGSMAAGQAGDTSGALAGPKNHTLTLTF